jgi:hypothetical protein
MTWFELYFVIVVMGLGGIREERGLDKVFPK